jgi:hypothetical protein
MTLQSGSGAAQRLRHAIDRGATGDKVDAGDPAAAPLGTDEEAAGTPIPAEAADAAYRYETGRPSVSKPKPARVWAVVAASTAAAIAVIAVATFVSL